MWFLRVCQSVIARPATWRQSVATDRRRLPVLRSLALGLLLALTVGAGGQVQAASYAHQDAHPNVDYLALGDSVTFGYSPLVDPHNTKAFVSYANVVAQALHEHLTNAACPGVTSSRFISLSGPDWLCEPWLKQGFPLHVTYSGSQLQFAVSFLRSHPRTRLVTLLIGSNDLFRLQGLCQNDRTCIEKGLPGVLATVRANLNTIYATLRFKAHYFYQIVTLTYYSPNYRDQFTTGAVSQLNKVIANRAVAWGSAVADGFKAFGVASGFGDPCAAGLLIRTSATTCDIHPSLRGHALLAATVLAALRHAHREAA